MSREPIRIRRVFQTRAMRPALLWEISRRFRRLCPGYGQVAHVLRTLPPVAARVLPPSAAPRLACVKPAASVHPEPGSNSSLYYFPLSSPLSRILTSSSLMSVFTLLRSALQCLQTSPNRPLPWFHYSQRSILLPPRLPSLLPPLHSSSSPLQFLVVWDCKSTTFSFSHQMFQ